MTLVLPDTARPTNLTLSAGGRASVLTSDVFDICGRVAELDPSLFIIELDHDDPRPYRYVVMESGPDGVDRLVLRVRRGELDARIIDRLRYMLHVPFDDRVRALERENDEWEKQQAEDRSEEAYDRVGQRMHYELERCGFIDSRGVSYAKRGVAAPERAR